MFHQLRGLHRQAHAEVFWAMKRLPLPLRRELAHGFLERRQRRGRVGHGPGLGSNSGPPADRVRIASNTSLCERKGGTIAAERCESIASKWKGRRVRICLAVTVTAGCGKAHLGSSSD